MEESAINGATLRGSSSCFRMSICLIIKQKPGPVCPWRVVCRTTGFVGRLELPGGTARRRGSFKNDNGKGLRHEGKRSEEHTSELQSLMRISYAVFCLKKKKK